MKRNSTKRTLKYLAICNDPQAMSAILRNAPDAVVKKICDIALNALKGDVALTNKAKKLFRQHRDEIRTFASRSVRLPKKREILVQKGSGFWIPALIGSVVGALGSSLFGPKQ
jgi:ABC-type methionine transport system ATPase subunit